MGRRVCTRRSTSHGCPCQTTLHIGRVSGVKKHAEERYAYFDGEVVAISGASLWHNRIVRNLMWAIDTRLEAKSCEVLPTDMRIKVPKALPYRYADLVVVCGEPVIEDMQGLEVLVNPLIIFEVYRLQLRRMTGG